MSPALTRGMSSGAFTRRNLFSATMSTRQMRQVAFSVFLKRRAAPVRRSRKTAPQLSLDSRLPGVQGELGGGLPRSAHRGRPSLQEDGKRHLPPIDKGSNAYYNTWVSVVDSSMRGGHAVETTITRTSLAAFPARVRIPTKPRHSQRLARCYSGF